MHGVSIADPMRLARFSHGATKQRAVRQTGNKQGQVSLPDGVTAYFGIQHCDKAPIAVVLEHEHYPVLWLPLRSCLRSSLPPSPPGYEATPECDTAVDAPATLKAG